MMDDRKEISDGFVRAVLEDNKHLREEMAALKLAHQTAQMKANNERDRLLRDIFQLVDGAGGDVRLIPDRSGVYSEPKRLLCEDSGYGTRRYRLVPDTEVVVYGEVVSPVEDDAAVPA